ncbi:hypothetical protein ACGLWX_05650 [Halomonas sp. HMF6819]|uniref:hypothetical protein n=1 Tax=Halomonas sp. HMF6819 TaxID=3373085 RepID=UPI0037BAA352
MATCEATKLRLSFEMTFVFSETLPEVEFDALTVATTRLSHGVDSYAYRFTEKPVPALDTEKLIEHGVPRGPIWGQLHKGEDIEWQGATLKSEAYLKREQPPIKIVVAGDNDRPELLAGACKGAQVLVHEATYTAAMADKAAEVRHSYARQVAEFAEAAGLPHLVLTHFSPRYQSRAQTSSSIEEIRAEAERVYSGTLVLARDFLELGLDKVGNLSEVVPADTFNAT